MDAKALPARPSLEQYTKEAKELVKSRASGDPEAVRRIEAHYPRPAKVERAAANTARFTLADAQLVIAREHAFESWPTFATHIEGLARTRSAVTQFEAAVDAIVDGEAASFERLLNERPDLARARSTRVHRATLLHYASANGVEDYRQRSPANAARLAELLLKGGAEVDAVADMYGGDCTTMDLLVSSIHPAKAGVQVALVDTLVDFGAAIDGLKGDGSPLMTALAFGYPDAAEALVRRGARIPNIMAAAALGRVDLVSGWLDGNGGLTSDAPVTAVRWPRLAANGKVHVDWSLIWAAMHGRTSVVQLLIDRGVALDVNDHQGFTPLHWASWNRHLDTMAVLIAASAPLEARNIYGGTVLDSTVYGAVHSGAPADYVPTLERLIVAGADLDAVDYLTGIEVIDAVLRRHRRSSAVDK